MKIINLVDKLPRLKDWAVRSTSDIKYLIIHHDVATRKGNDIERYKDQARYHMSKGWPGLGYHFKIADDGTIYRCNRNWEITYHASNYNSYSIGICLDGFLHPGHDKVTNKQRQALFDLIDRLRANYNISRKNVLGHRDINSTACPGDYGYIQVLDYRNNKIEKEREVKLYRKKDSGTVYLRQGDTGYPVKSADAFNDWFGKDAWDYVEDVSKLPFRADKDFAIKRPKKMDRDWNARVARLEDKLEKHKKELRLRGETIDTLVFEHEELAGLIDGVQDRYKDLEEENKALRKQLSSLEGESPTDKPDTESSLWNKLVKFIKTIILRRKDEK